MNYPEHKYSKYIDQQFSYDNKVNYPSKVDLVDLLKYQRKDGTIMLEPRLQEYIKKKSYYKHNSIEPCIKPEIEFCITDRDKRIIKDFLKGKTDIYTPTGSAMNHLKKDRSYRKQHFPSRTFRDDDIRVQKIQKLKTDKTPINRGMFVPDHSDGRFFEDPVDDSIQILDARDFKDTKTGEGWKLDQSRYNPAIDPKIDSGRPDRNKYTSQYRIDPLKEQKKCASYGTYATPNFSGISDMDTDLKIVIPTVASNSKRDLSTYDYKMNSYMTEQKPIRDAEFETTLLRGMPIHTKKSYGYRNPEEHYYEYIDDDFQNADNTVLPFPRGGEGTRHNNKKTAKQRYQ